MLTWWNNLILSQQIFAVFALPATLVLVIQTVLLLLGMGNESADSADAPVDGAKEADFMQEGVDPGLRIFTVRGLVAFFAVGGWVGIALVDQGIKTATASLLALAAGLLALLFVAWLFKVLLRLQSSGNIDIGNAAGSIGSVYLRIPAGGKGSGKVTLTIQERTREFDAVTESDEELATGSEVTVTGYRGSLLIVAPLRRQEKQNNQKHTSN